MSSAVRPLSPAPAAIEAILEHGQLHTATPSASCRSMMLAGVDYVCKQGGPVVLGHGSIVEGSLGYRGLQPNYVIDMHHPELADVVAFARNIAKGALPVFERVAEVTGFVGTAIRAKAYASKPYITLLAEKRAAGENVSLGDYLACSCGTCREHALVTHLALNEAGVPSKYIYCQATARTRTEDHAVALFEHGGTTWVADAYNRCFNGLRLADLQRAGGSRAQDPRAPFAAPPIYGCSLAPMPYPRFWMPQ